MDFAIYDTLSQETLLVDYVYRSSSPMNAKGPRRAARSKLKQLASERRTEEYIARCDEHLQWVRNKVGRESMSACIALVDLGDGYNFIGDFESANKMYVEALEIVKKKHGEDNGLHNQILESFVETRRRIDSDPDNSP